MRRLLWILVLACVSCAPPAPQTVPPAGPATSAALQIGGAPLALRDTSVLPRAAGSVKFAVIGDTGTGGREQYQIAALMNEARGWFPYTFVIMLGDNIYGRDRPGDFVRKFERPYKPLLDAGVTFHATLGNHDGPSQQRYAPFHMGGRRFYAFQRGDVEFFVLDSGDMSPAQLTWLKDALARSTARWKIAYMHHPLYSSGTKHGSEVALRTRVEPLLVEHGVSAVFAGHDHFYERVKPQQGIAYFVEGGSAKLRKGNISRRSTLTQAGLDTDNSFMLIEIEQDRMFFETISRKNQVVDSGAIPRRLGRTGAPR